MVMEMHSAPSGPAATGSWMVARSPGASDWMVEWLARVRWFLGATDITDFGADAVPRFSMTSVTVSEAADWYGSNADTTLSK